MSKSKRTIVQATLLLELDVLTSALAALTSTLLIRSASPKKGRKERVSEHRGSNSKVPPHQQHHDHPPRHLPTNDLLRFTTRSFLTLYARYILVAWLDILLLTTNSDDRILITKRFSTGVLPQTSNYYQLNYSIHVCVYIVSNEPNRDYVNLEHNVHLTPPF